MDLTLILTPTLTPTLTLTLTLSLSLTLTQGEGGYRAIGGPVLASEANPKPKPKPKPNPNPNPNPSPKPIVPSGCLAKWRRTGSLCDPGQG